MALQVTYLQILGKLPLTLEAATTRLFVQGRIEAVRTLTPEAAAFCRLVLPHAHTSHAPPSLSTLPPVPLEVCTSD